MTQIETVTVTLPLSERASYQRHVVENGHVPGVLSGAELRGKAKRFGYGYAVARTKVALLLNETYEITSGRALVNRRWSRIWMRYDGTPVRLVFA